MGEFGEQHPELTDEEREKYETFDNAFLAGPTLLMRASFSGVPVAVVAMHDYDPDSEGDERVSIIPVAILVTDQVFEHLQPTGEPDIVEVAQP